MEGEHLRLQILKQGGSQLSPHDFPESPVFLTFSSGLPRETIAILKVPEGRRLCLRQVGTRWALVTL